MRHVLLLGANSEMVKAILQHLHNHPTSIVLVMDSPADTKPEPPKLDAGVLEAFRKPLVTEENISKPNILRPGDKRKQFKPTGKIHGQGFQARQKPRMKTGQYR